VDYGTWGLLLSFDGLKSSLGQGPDFATRLPARRPKIRGGASIVTPSDAHEFVNKIYEYPSVKPWGTRVTPRRWACCDELFNDCKIGNLAMAPSRRPQGNAFVELSA